MLCCSPGKEQGKIRISDRGLSLEADEILSMLLLLLLVRGENPRVGRLSTR